MCRVGVSRRTDPTPQSHQGLSQRTLRLTGPAYYFLAGSLAEDPASHLFSALGHPKLNYKYSTLKGAYVELGSHEGPILLHSPCVELGSHEETDPTPQSPAGSLAEDPASHENISREYLNISKICYL